MSNETPYQVAPQVAALNAERENAVAYGDEQRVAQIDRRLADLSVKKEAAEKRAEKETRSEAPKGRRAKESTQARAETAEAFGEA